MDLDSLEDDSNRLPKGTALKTILLLLRPSWVRITIATVIALIGGGSNAGVIALVNAALSDASPSKQFLVWSIVGLGVVRLTTGAISQVLLTTFAQSTMLNLRRSLCRRILATPLRQLETIGPYRLLVALTEDAMSIRIFLATLPQLTVDIAILIGCVFYLAWLSWKGSLIMFGVVALGVIFYRALLTKAMRSFRLARDVQDLLFRHYRSLTEGIKELRIHRKRREAFLSRNIEPTTEAFRRHSVVAMTHFIIAFSWSQFVFFVVIGLLLLVLPTLDNVGKPTLTGYVLTILYLMGPMRDLMHMFPSLGRANIAMAKIETLGLSLVSGPEENGLSAGGSHAAWKRLDLKGVVFAYHQELGNSDFVLGPMDLTLCPGELVFLVGGNGSGKSTFAKVLTGLYALEAGEIRMDGQLITDENRDWYRQHFSVVFSDFYVFDHLLGLESANLDERAGDYLSLLKLAEKVQVNNGTLSTTALSQGQRRRLALLTAYLEDRPIYVFDEWAADQDPEYKNVFYTQLLPELKAAGKGVVVITHDDRYFHIADRIVKLDYGKTVALGPIPMTAYRQNVPAPASIS
jgi:putative ATP-binding cassette transporter